VPIITAARSCSERAIRSSIVAVHALTQYPRPPMRTASIPLPPLSALELEHLARAVRVLDEEQPQPAVGLLDQAALLHLAVHALPAGEAVVAVLVDLREDLRDLLIVRPELPVALGALAELCG